MLRDWWFGGEWAAYERACGRDGERVRELMRATWQTRVLDLRQDLPTLWRGVRRSYHAIINRLERDLAFKIALVGPALFLEWCQPLHAMASGRVTRPLRSWKCQADWIDRDMAIALVALRDTTPADPEAVRAEPVGFAYIIISDTEAYYFSSAALEPNVQHALQWKAIGILKARGVQFYELGWQGHATDEKGLSVEFFRRGFGGEDRTAKL